LGVNSEIVDIAIESKRYWICVVPEKREERTTEGGLNLKDASQRDKIEAACAKFKKEIPGVKVSLFVEDDPETLRRCFAMNIDAVEIHTGDYARAFLEDNPVEERLESFARAKELVENAGIGFHAGHGLTDKSLRPLSERSLFSEYNIGHWIVCDSVFCGLESSIKKLTTILKEK
ncbi:MAG: pyridoxine 5'-phosphate synthase, partial [Bacteriovoracaceae bacterium]